MKGGVYIYRCRKPGAFLGWPIVGRHFAYVGETTSFFHRHGQHMESQPWSDLSPVCYRIPLPTWKPLLHAVETLFILALWPVYNHKKNLWNPRRIPLHVAKAMRARRRLPIYWAFRLWLALRSLCMLITVGLLVWGWWHYVR